MQAKWPFIFLLSVFFITSASGEELPLYWPWKGVSIENNYYDPEDLNVLDNKINININTIQLRLKPRKLAKRKKISPADAWNESIQWAEKILDICEENGLGAILTMEGFPLDPSVDYNQSSPKFWLDSKNIDEVIDIAAALSKQFSRRGKELLAYQLLSEPVIKIAGKSFSPPQWNKLQNSIIEAIRKNDPQRWISVSPAPWGLPTSYKRYDLLPYKRIIYGAHMYAPHAYTHQGIRKYKDKKYIYPGNINGKNWDKKQLEVALKDLRRFQLQHKVPVWIGEFSAIRWAPGSEQYIKDLVNIFSSYNWSWTYFSLNGWHGWNPNYSSSYSSEKKWKRDYIGLESPRWKMLKSIFNTIDNN